MKRISKTILLTLFSSANFFFTSCEKDAQTETKRAQMPPPAVDVEPVIVKPFTAKFEFAGRTAASSRVDIQAEISGRLESLHFNSGQYVTKDQLLFTIDSEHYALMVEKLDAQKQKAEANVGIKTTAYEKRKAVFDKSRGVSEIDVLIADAERKAAIAEVKVTQSALDDAQRDLNHTKIVAPIEGRISKYNVTEGNLILASERFVMATIVQDNPLYFDFQVSEREVLPYLNRRPSKDSPEYKNIEANLELYLADGSIYPKKGKINYIDNGVDPESGSFTIRAEFENPEGLLAEGLFARIAIPKNIEDAMFVKKTAIQRDLAGYFIYCLSAENTVKKQYIQPTKLEQGKLRLIQDKTDSKNKLTAEDKVIVSNLQKIAPGMKVIVAAPKPQQ